jgi:serpin B
MASTHNAFTFRNGRVLSRRRVAASGAIGLYAAFSSACAGGQTGDEHTDTGDIIQELSGDAERLAASGSLPNSASSDGWEFGWKLYGEEAGTENTFFSPYSISVASAMLVAGAGGQTKTEIQSALEFSSEGDIFNQAWNSVAQALEARNRPGSEEANAQALRVTNDLWLAPAFRPLPAFLDTLSAYYGASTFLAPFDTDPEAARQAINDKIADDTEQLIPDLLPQNSVNDAVFVLTNAIYFKANWVSEFAPSATADAPFTALTGASAVVPMMHTTYTANHVSTADYEAISLPYDHNELELVAVMPTEGTFTAFAEALTASSIRSITDSLEPAYVALSFPKISIDGNVPLKARLQALGMASAFEPANADFTAIGSNIYISDAFHQAKLVIDEKGTEAAAATAIVGVATSLPPEPIAAVFDHPFVFFIRDIQTNALLFVGQYVTPGD